MGSAKVKNVERIGRFDFPAKEAAPCFEKSSHVLAPMEAVSAISNAGEKGGPEGVDDVEGGIGPAQFCLRSGAVLSPCRQMQAKGQHAQPDQTVRAHRFLHGGVELGWPSGV